MAKRKSIGKQQTGISFWNASSTKQAAIRGATLTGSASLGRSLGRGLPRKGYRAARAVGGSRSASVTGAGLGLGIKTAGAATVGAGLGAGYHHFKNSAHSPANSRNTVSEVRTHGRVRRKG